MAAGKKKAATAVAVPEEKNTSMAMYDAEDMGAGFEDFTSDDLAIPFINILQKGSPAVEEDSPHHVKGAKAGMLFNSVTQELFDGKEKGVLVIPVHRIHQYVEWRDRDAGGGFVAAHEVDSPLVKEAKKGGAFGKLETPDGNQLVETFDMYALLVTDEGDFTPVIIPFSSTRIKAYKRWMTTARSIVLKVDGRRFPAPMFSHVYRLLTQFQENNKGTWYSNVVLSGDDAESSRLAPDSELYKAAKGFRDLVLSGATKANYGSMEEPEGSEDSGGEEDDGKPF